MEAVPGVSVSETSVAGVTVKFADPVIAFERAVTTAAPTPVLLASPDTLIVNTVVSLELQVALPVKSCVVPSVYVPSTVNCCLVPSATDALPGVTASALRAAGVTVSVVEPVTEPEVAETIVCPVATLVAKPLADGELLTVATVVTLEFHVTVPVISCVVPSV